MSGSLIIQGYDPEPLTSDVERDYATTKHLESHRLVVDRFGKHGVKITLNGSAIALPDFHNFIAALQQIKEPRP